MTHQSAPTVVGTRTQPSGMYLVNLRNLSSASPSCTPTAPHINSVYSMHTKVDLVTYLHLCAWSPVVDTWCNAIDRGSFTTWPGLSSPLVRKHLPKSLPTAKGHLKLTRKNLRSTQPTADPVTPPTIMTTAPALPEPQLRTNLVVVKTIELTGKIATDQTGRFPVTSSKGSRYLMVAHVQDPNAIMAEPLNSRSTNDLVEAYSRIFTYLKGRGLTPLFQKSNNECPAAFKAFLTKNDIAYQLAPPLRPPHQPGRESH